MANYAVPPVSTTLRRFILERDDYTCRYCGHRPDRLQEPAYKWFRASANLHVDHIWPRSKGGTNEEQNLVTACTSCNLSKHDKVWVPLELECCVCMELERIPDPNNACIDYHRDGLFFECDSCIEATEPGVSDLDVEQRYWDTQEAV